LPDFRTAVEKLPLDKPLYLLTAKSELLLYQLVVALMGSPSKSVTCAEQVKSSLVVFAPKVLTKNGFEVVGGLLTGAAWHALFEHVWLTGHPHTLHLPTSVPLSQYTGLVAEHWL
jgi:predicted metal-dependent peptidase